MQVNWRIRLANLLTIKSLVTILLTIVFCILSLTHVIQPEQFMQIFLMVIAFYFGSTKRDDTSKDKTP